MKLRLTSSHSRSPSDAVDPGDAVFALDFRGGFQHAAVVEVDAIAGHMLDGEPVARLEVPLRRTRALAEHRIVVVEAFQHETRDAAGLVGNGIAGRSAAAEEIGVAMA